jgi:uncharacterized protein YchJ
VGNKIAETAEELMRSRYSAYSTKAVSWVIKSTHPDNKSVAGSLVDGKQVSTFKVHL